MRIGLIARGCNSGLGVLSAEFYRNLKEYITKVLVINNGVYQCFPQRFERTIAYTAGDLRPKLLEDFLQDIDILLAIETPYNWFSFSLAKLKGIKTVLIPMFECNDKPLEVYPDLIVCPTYIDYEAFRSERSRLEVIPLPVNRELVPFRKRRKAMTFKHHVGHGGLAGRTGISVITKAIPMVKNRNVGFIINSQVPILNINDARAVVNIGNVKNYWDLWNEGDVYLFPTNQEMLSMPLHEALSAGMPVLTTGFDYFKSFLPEDWLIKPNNVFRAKLHQRFMNHAEIDPETLAKKIDEWAEKDICKDSEIANQIAEELSWEKLKPKWVKLFESL